MSLFTKSACLTFLATTFLGLPSQQALASGDSCHVDLNIKFIESAPRDRFVTLVPPLMQRQAARTER